MRVLPLLWFLSTDKGSKRDATEAGIPNIILKRRFPAYFLAGRGIGLTPTCSSAVYGAP